MPGADFSHPNDKMRNGYRQNTYGWEKFLKTSPRLTQIQFTIGHRIAAIYRTKQRRSGKPGAHTANMIRVNMKSPGGRRMDRMETTITAYGPAAATEEFGNKRHKKQGNLRKSLVTISAGKTISRTGKVRG